MNAFQNPSLMAPQRLAGIWYQSANQSLWETVVAASLLTKAPAFSSANARIVLNAMGSTNRAYLRASFATKPRFVVMQNCEST